MSQLTDDERRLLGYIRAETCAPACPCVTWKQGLADQLREENPDVDDVTLARILLTTAGRITVLTLFHKLNGPRTAAIVSGAAVELAALELDHPTR